MSWSVLRRSANSHQVEQAAELPIGVWSAGLQLYSEHKILVVVGEALPCPSVGEQADAVPGNRFDLADGEHANALDLAPGAGLRLRL